MISATEVSTTKPVWRKVALTILYMHHMLFTQTGCTMSQAKDNARLKSYKNKSLNTEEMRRRREEEGLQLRKQKKDEQVTVNCELQGCIWNELSFNTPRYMFSINVLLILALTFCSFSRGGMLQQWKMIASQRMMGWLTVVIWSHRLTTWTHSW